MVTLINISSSSRWLCCTLSNKCTILKCRTRCVWLVCVCGVRCAVCGVRCVVCVCACGVCHSFASLMSPDLSGGQSAGADGSSAPAPAAAAAVGHAWRHAQPPPLVTRGYNRGRLYLSTLHVCASHVHVLDVRAPNWHHCCRISLFMRICVTVAITFIDNQMHQNLMHSAGRLVAWARLACPA